MLRVTEMVLQGIKYIFTSLPSDINDFVSLKKSRDRNVNWYVQKEILGWILDLEKGTFQLPFR